MTMLISVIIATHNRCDSLKDTLDSLLKQDNREDFDYKVIVVDNNSTDKTERIVSELKPSFQDRLQYIFEPRQGKSYALNRGIEKSRGDVVVFTDDDCIADKQWLKTITRDFSENNCDCAFGKILPLWLTRDIPAWLSRDKRLWGKLAILDYGEQLKTVTTDKYPPYGANLAVKNSTLKECGGFNIELGPQGNKLTRGEDTALFYKLLENNKAIIYDPRILVFHKIEAYKTRAAYFRKWYFHSGTSYALNLTDKGYRNIFGVPVWYMREMPRIFWTYLRSIFFNPRDCFIEQLKFIFCIGVFSGCIKKWLKNA